MKILSKKILYLRINFENFYEFINGEDDIQNFLIDNFDIQTRFHAVNSYLKYFYEFEKIFDINIEVSMDSQLLKIIEKKSKIDKEAFSVLGKETSDVNNSLVRFILN